ncbi:MAG: SigB/SigF/SigG family RNA polymerase sigma factor [Subdoligranulum variabile]|nr:SigB/SigF/SigG family RNA polymerase sigma factor [Subdoligranulum variabile]
MVARKVELCGMDTSQLPVLSEAEKSRLIEAAHNGDQAARQQMIQGNLRLVLSVVQKFSGRGENLDDLFQVGCIGLIKAIDNFDTSQNVRFSTYGVPMICGEVKRYLRDNNPVRISRSIRDLAYHSMQAREELQKRDGREPKISEIAAKVGASPENVAMALESAIAPTSLYEPVFSDGEDSFSVMDQLRDQTSEESWISDMMFRDTVRALSPRERRIIALRYLSGKTQTEVAKEIGISQAQVSRLEKGALCQIREQISNC